MKIIIAVDSFKGSISTVIAAETIKKGIEKVFPQADIVKIPMADGGEGTVDALVIGTGGIKKQVEVTGPLGEKIISEYGIINKDIAVIEMAAASGLPLVPENKRNPLVTTSYGTGELIKAALEEGCRKIIMGVGGSATNDGGVGMAQALGMSFKDNSNCEIAYGGGALSNIDSIDSKALDERLKECEFIIASDVTNTLCGDEGASAIYGPQKGATKEMIIILDNNLRHLAQKIKDDCNKDVLNIQGCGAAGGLPTLLLSYANVTLKAGIEIVLDTINFEEYLLNADLVITGEGRIDKQSVYGKVPVGVAKKAKKYNIPVLAIVGGIGEGASAVYEHGVDSIMSIVNRPMSLSEAMENSTELLEDVTERIMRNIKINVSY